MAIPKLGSGKRFKQLANKMAREGVDDSNAVAASIGIKKWGEKRMSKLAQSGKKRHEK
jgi:hypothetical protein